MTTATGAPAVLVGPGEDDTDRREALAFLHAQSYGAGTAAAAIGAVDPRGALRRGPARPASLFADPAARAVREAFRIRRVAPEDAYPLHRAFPSARGVGVALAALRREGPHGPSAWRYDPARDEMVHAGGSLDPGDRTAAVAVLVEASGLPSAYGDLRYALAFLEAGHAAMTLAACLAPAGLPPTGETDFADPDLERAFALGATEAPAVLFSLDGEGPGPALDGAEQVGPGDEVTATDRRCRRQRPARGARVRRDPGPPPGCLGLPDTLDTRTSGGGTADVVARSGPVPDAVLADLAAVLGDPWALEDAPGVAATLVSARTVRGAEHRLAEDAAAPAEDRLRHDPPSLLAALTAPGRALDGGPLPLAVTWLVDYPAAVRTHGPRAQRTVQVRLGWSAQLAGLVLARHGLFSRPRRSLSPRLVDAVMGLDGLDVQVGYQVVGGVDATGADDLAPDLAALDGVLAGHPPPATARRPAPAPRGEL